MCIVKTNRSVQRFICCESIKKAYKNCPEGKVVIGQLTMHVTIILFSVQRFICCESIKKTYKNCPEGKVVIGQLTMHVTIILFLRKLKFMLKMVLTINKRPSPLD